MASRMDETSEVARRALDTIEGKMNPQTTLSDSGGSTPSPKTGKKMVDVMVEKGQFFLEVIFVRHIENYLNYLSSLLFEIFTQRPETLRSSEKVEVSFVLGCTSINDIIRALAERKVEGLSYESVAELSTFFHDRFNLDLFSTLEIDIVVEAIETRNISVHNRCIVNGRYLTRTRRDKSLIGKRRNIYFSDIEKIVPLLGEAVKRLDKHAQAKLRLRGTRFRTPAAGSTSSTAARNGKGK